MYLNSLQIIADTKKGAESRVAQYILDNKSDIMNMKLSKISDEAYVSMSSISRLTKKLNVADFATLKIELAKELKDLEYAKNLKASPVILKQIESFRVLNSMQLINFLKLNCNEHVNFISGVDLSFVYDLIFKNNFNILNRYDNNKGLNIIICSGEDYLIEYETNKLIVTVKENDDILFKRIFLLSLIAMILEER